MVTSNELFFYDSIQNPHFKLEYNFNLNNTMNMSEDLKKHVIMLESMSPKDRVNVIGDMEYNIAAYDNNVMYAQDLKKKKRNLRNSSGKLDIIFNSIAIKEGEIDDFYKEIKTVLDKDKLTFYEFQNLQREYQIKAILNKCELDDLLTNAYLELKIYNKYVNDLKLENAAQQNVSKLIEKANCYLIEAKHLEMEDIDRIIKNTNTKKQDRETEAINEDNDIEQQMKKIRKDPSTDRDHRITKSNKKYEDKKYKKIPRNKITNSPKKIIFQNGNSKKDKKGKSANKKIKINNKSKSHSKLDNKDKYNICKDQTTNKVKSNVKDDYIKSDKKCVENVINDEESRELKNNITKEQNIPANVGCCNRTNSKDAHIRNNKAQLHSVKDINKSLNDENRNFDNKLTTSLQEENKNLKRKSEEFVDLKVPTKRELRSDSPVTNAKLPNSKSKLRSNSKSKEAKPKSNTPPFKNRKKNLTNKNNKKVEDNNVLLNKVNTINKSPGKIYADEKEIDGENRTKNSENVEFKEEEKNSREEKTKLKDKDSNKFKSDMDSSLNIKKYLSESDILRKKKDNISRYESYFSKENKNKSAVINADEEISTNDKRENKIDEDNYLRTVERLKLQRINKLIMDERDRIIIKNRDLESKRSTEKERWDRKIKQNEFDDNKSHHNEQESNERTNRKKTPVIENEPLHNKEIERQSKVIFDYQKLLSESRNRQNQLVKHNIYDQPIFINKMINKTSIEEDKNVLNNEILICQPETEDIKEEVRINENDVKIQNETMHENEYKDMGNTAIPDDEIQNEYQNEKIHENINIGVAHEKLQDSEINHEKDKMEIKDLEEREKSEPEKVNKSELENTSKICENETKPLKNQTGLVDFDKQDGLIDELMVKETKDKSTKSGCVCMKRKTLKTKQLEVEVNQDEIILSEIKGLKTSEMSSENERSETSIVIDNAYDPNTEVDTYIEPVKAIESDDDEDDSIISDNEISNPKFWKKNIFYIEPKTLLEKKIACIIRAKPGSMPNRKLLKCELIQSSDEVPYLDQREDYSSYIFKIYPRTKDIDSKITFDVPWHVAIPYYLPETSSKQPLIMQMNDEQNRWIECVTYDVIFENFKQNEFKFVETKINKPYGTYAVVTYLNKDRTVVNREGVQMTSTSDRDIVLSVPPDAVRISINTSLQVTSLDKTFWNEIREKHEKSVIDGICSSSSVVEIEAKKKKLTIPASLTLTLPQNVPQIEERFIKRKITTETEYGNSKMEDEKCLQEKKILNPFQKTLLMPVVNSASNIQDVHFLSYINEEERWNIIENPNLNYDKLKEQMNVELPFIQSSKYMLLKSKRKTSDETIAKAAKIIDNELCVRNCVIALFQSNKSSNEFALIISLKKYFQNHINNLQEEGYLIDTFNKLTYVELKERQALTMEFVGNIKTLIPENNETKFAFHSLFPNTQKFRVKEIDSFSQKAVTSFRGYLDLYTKSLVKKPVQGLDGKVRKNQSQYTWIEENTLICHLLISIKKGKIPIIPPFYNLKFQFKNFHHCINIIKKVSSKIGLNWWELGSFLNVTETRMHSIKLHNQEKGLHKMAEQMLLFWLKGCETNENKYDLLNAALKNCGRFDIVERIQKPLERHLFFGC